MDPIFRPAPLDGAPSEPLPEGCVVEDIGVWRGQRTELLYNPLRHTVVFMPVSYRRLGPAIADTGYALFDSSGGWDCWVRDRALVMQARLATVYEPPALDGLSLA